MLKLPKIEYYRPTSVDEALHFLTERKGLSKVVAGGTDLLVSLKHKLFKPTFLVDIKQLSELHRVDYDEKKGLTIGSLTTLREISTSPLINEKYPVLAKASECIGSTQIRYMGTVGGNICLNTRCWFYNIPLFARQSREPCVKNGGDVCHVVKAKKECFSVYSGDMAAILICLNAKINIVNPQHEKNILLKDFFTGNGMDPNILNDDELVTKIQIRPITGRWGAIYSKLRLRQEVDFPILGVAAYIHLEDDICSECKIILNAVSSSPIEVKEAENVFEKKRISGSMVEEVVEAAYQISHPVSNTAGSPSYRRKMVRVYVKEAIEEALRIARGN